MISKPGGEWECWKPAMKSAAMGRGDWFGYVMGNKNTWPHSHIDLWGRAVRLFIQFMVHDSNITAVDSFFFFFFKNEQFFIVYIYFSFFTIILKQSWVLNGLFCYLVHREGCWGEGAVCVRGIGVVQYIWRAGQQYKVYMLQTKHIRLSLSVVLRAWRTDNCWLEITESFMV